MEAAPALNGDEANRESLALGETGAIDSPLLNVGG